MQLHVVDNVKVRNDLEVLARINRIESIVFLGHRDDKLDMLGASDVLFPFQREGLLKQLWNLQLLQNKLSVQIQEGHVTTHVNENGVLVDLTIKGEL